MVGYCVIHISFDFIERKVMEGNNHQIVPKTALTRRAAHSHLAKPCLNRASAPEVEDGAAAVSLEVAELPELAAEVADADVSVGRLVEAPVDVLVPDISEIDTKVPVARLTPEVEAAVPLAAVVENTGVMGSVGKEMESLLVPAADIRLLQKDGL